MFMRFFLFIILFLSLTLEYSYAATKARIKDIVYFEGIRDNLLVGYGLVVGLNGTGDNLNNSIFTQKGLTDLLERLGISTRGANLKTKNIAAVTVTAVLPPFARQGSRIDVQVSTLGDAKSLQDGTLVATPLLGADGHVYAVAQGKIIVGGIKGQEVDGTRFSKDVVTNATITNGAIIEREIAFKLETLDNIKLALHNPDITTASKIAYAINLAMVEELAKATDPGTVELFVPIKYKNSIVDYLAEIEQIVVDIDSIAKIVIDESSGTVVMGNNVKISPIAISQGNLSVVIKPQKDVIIDDIFRDRELEQNDTTPNYDPEEKGNQMVIMPGGATLGELVDALNSLGVGPRDLISILNTMKSAGAIQANIELK